MRLPLRFLSHAAGLGLATLLLGAPLAGWAGPGHDHDHDHGGPAAPSAPALPRAVASSELFELVAVLDGRQLTVFVDRAATNEPLASAQLELELAGQKLAVQPVDPAQAGATGGDFTVTLPAALPPGVHPLTATVTAGADIDLLAGEFDIPDTTPADDHGGWLGELRAHGPGALGWGIGALLLGAAGVWQWRRRAARAEVLA
jgi:hypothetical protein